MTVQPRLPISVCLIAGNEAHRIRRALESVAGWTSEIIVVLNDDVNDGTDKMAGSFGANVFREPWKGHIAQKNSAARKAAHEWILGLDADEVDFTGVARRKFRNGLPNRRNSRPAPHSVFRAAPFIADAGFATATGIPTARPVCGGAARQNGAAWIRTTN